MINFKEYLAENWGNLKSLSKINIWRIRDLLKGAGYRQEFLGSNSDLYMIKNVKTFDDIKNKADMIVKKLESPPVLYIEYEYVDMNDSRSYIDSVTYIRHNTGWYSLPNKKPYYSLKYKNLKILKSFIVTRDEPAQILRGKREKNQPQKNEIKVDVSTFALMYNNKIDRMVDSIKKKFGNEAVYTRQSSRKNHDLTSKFFEVAETTKFGSVFKIPKLISIKDTLINNMSITERNKLLNKLNEMEKKILSLDIRYGDLMKIASGEKVNAVKFLVIAKKKSPRYRHDEVTEKINSLSVNGNIPLRDAKEILDRKGG